ncbi:MAG: zinc-binding alcohol dehydrogenase family protein [Bacteroidota bacterium]
MRAIVLHEPGAPEVLKLEERPLPKAVHGKVLIRVKAFGLNRSEMFTRQGHTPGFTYPRILGIECAGVVEECPSGRWEKGQQVVAIMGGLGRAYDGGYAEFTLVPERIVKAFSSELDWETLGAIPEMFQTANGSLEEALELKTGEKLLIRGGTSSIGMMSAQIAKRKGAYVIATTRSEHKMEALKENGVDQVIIDDGQLAPIIRDHHPKGVDKVLELIGTRTLRDSILCTKSRGIVCQTGILGNEWIMKDFQPFLDLPNLVRLTAYGGDSEDLSEHSLQSFLDDITAGYIKINIDKTFRMEEIVEAHTYMETNKAKGKLVVLT